jgi:choline-phosphate cytidylyltransferase
MSLANVVHSDKTTEKFKGKVANTERERYAVVKHIKHVDEIIGDCPWIVTNEFVDKHNVRLSLFFVMAFLLA